jgi:RP/EB family microtubule-associated protein
MQDNLEFLQWTKRFWDQYFPGGEYDAIGRRKASGAPSTSSAPMAAPRTSGAGTAAARRGVTPTSAVKRAIAGTGGNIGSNSALVTENAQLKETVTGLERERDFYFSKLRDIELLLQQAVEQQPEIEEDENGMVKQIQAILYSTEVSCALL